MTGRYKFKNYDTWVKKKKKLLLGYLTPIRQWSSEPLFQQFGRRFQQYGGRRHRFGSGGMEGGETNLATFVGATIPTVWSPILVVWWSETSIWRRRYRGQQDQSGGVRRNYYFGGHRSHYSDGLVTDSSGGRRHQFGGGGMVGGKTNPAAFVGATISAVRPLDLHHKQLHWASRRCWLFT